MQDEVGENRLGASTPPTDRLRAIVADDDPFVRQLVREALQRDGIVVIAEARTGREAVELTLHYRPEVLLMDIVMPEMDGISATRKVLAQAPDQSIVLLTGSSEDDLALLGLRAGAVGFLTKDQPVEALSRALRAVTRGEAAVSRDLTKQLVEYVQAVPDRETGRRPVQSPLTNREWEVLQLIAEKHSNTEIASALFVSLATVRSHVKSILRKLGVRTREEAVAAAEQVR